MKYLYPHVLSHLIWSDDQIPGKELTRGVLEIKQIGEVTASEGKAKKWQR